MALWSQIDSAADFFCALKTCQSTSFYIFVVLFKSGWCNIPKNRWCVWTMRTSLTPSLKCPKGSYCSKRYFNFFSYLLLPTKLHKWNEWLIFTNIFFSDRNSFIVKNISVQSFLIFIKFVKLYLVKTGPKLCGSEEVGRSFDQKTNVTTVICW